VPAVSPSKQAQNNYDIDMDVEEMNSRFLNAKLQSSEKKPESF
jgi:hypothetical protein